jgi:hypothetical protein
VIIVYPNSRSTEVRARCHIRGVPLLGAANRLDIEELASFDREDGSSASMLQPGGCLLINVCTVFCGCAGCWVLVNGQL